MAGRIGLGLQLFIAAQPQQLVHQQRAVDAQIGIDRHQPVGRRHRDRTAQAQEGRQVHHRVQPAAQVGHTQHPRLRVRHRLKWDWRENFAGLLERKQQAQARALDRQPVRGLGRLARRLHALRQPLLKFAQRLLVGHGVSPAP